jgi:hypothetical protein
MRASPPPAVPKPAEQFPPSLKEGGRFYVPDGIIAQMSRECGANVHGCRAVDVRSGRFGSKETYGANSHSGAHGNDPKWAADLEDDSRFCSAHREKEENIPHAKSNWVCYNFKERRILPTHCTIRCH